MVAMLEIFDWFVRQDDIVEECHGDARQITGSISKHQPLCCFVLKRDPDVLARAYEKAGVEPPGYHG